MHSIEITARIVAKELQTIISFILIPILSCFIYFLSSRQPR
ncbi:MAG: hypothetical protein PHH76_03850 [Methanothrix soehngenii]|nr:hypothetical protein [Methanothrix soehngenii]MDD5256679.1 hypothetical protein [Methanothrix soehngenii]